LERCSVDGICLHANEGIKLVDKRLALCNLDPCGGALPSNFLLIEPKHTRSDNSLPGDMHAIAGGQHANVDAMDPMITIKSRLYYTQLKVLTML
jgi:hypothetical protein